MPRDCEQRCPELDACINASLWCDGVSHCPSGYDEALSHCSIILRLPPLHLGLGALVIVAIIALMCFTVWRIFRQRTNRSISQHRLKSISSETAIIDGKEVICWQNDSSVRYVEVDRVTTVWRSSPLIGVRVILEAINNSLRCRKPIDNSINHCRHLTFLLFTRFHLFRAISSRKLEPLPRNAQNCLYLINPKNRSINYFILFSKCDFSAFFNHGNHSPFRYPIKEFSFLFFLPKIEFLPKRM